MYCNFETGSCLTGNMDANDFTAIFGLSDSEVNVNEQYLSILTELDWTCLWSEQYLERTELDWTSSEGLSCVLCGLNWTAPVFTFSAVSYHVDWTGLHVFLPFQQCLIMWTELDCTCFYLFSNVLSCGLNWTAPVFTFSAKCNHMDWTGLHLFLPS